MIHGDGPATLYRCRTCSCIHHEAGRCPSCGGDDMEVLRVGRSLAIVAAFLVLLIVAASVIGFETGRAVAFVWGSCVLGLILMLGRHAGRIR